MERHKNKQMEKQSSRANWEMSGYIKHPAFTTYPNAFPKKLIDEFIEKTGVKGVLAMKLALEQKF